MLLWRKAWVLAVICLLLAGFNWSVAQKEGLRANGREVLLPLAPVDPRALLMGDYMALEYSMNEEVTAALRSVYGADRDRRRDMPRSSWPAEGLAIVRITGEPTRVAGRRAGQETAPAGTAFFMRLDDGRPLAADECRLFYRVHGKRAHVAAGAFYFQEGHGAVYERQARYGLLRLGMDGKNLLTGLADAEGRPLMRPAEKKDDARQ